MVAHQESENHNDSLRNQIYKIKISSNRIPKISIRLFNGFINKEKIIIIPNDTRKKAICCKISEILKL